MKILAIDFSSPQRSVAVLSASGAAELLETDPKATDPLGIIEAVLRGAQLRREQIEGIAIGLGPGSYTGIRASIALAQGWQLARGVKLLGVSSAEVIAAQARTDGRSGMVHVVIDAQRGEFYLTTFELTADSVRELAPLKIVSLAELHQREQAGEVLLGPEVTRWFPGGSIVFPRAATLAQLASTRTDFVAGEKLEPIYLRETTFVKAPPARNIQ
ncbi:MAG: tRNA (adenosine(37)-N6)-threonylcarbamoyltransferase complex dimerization subunit type 1 TsaB [Akkermansiaceae bacterium]|nr:tRNA (adenosine(37)-N6)-threonylcarbamoyltransferase complex dimerization subunit type 1 TsaB [Verrucomicrobiales bacterium]